MIDEIGRKSGDEIQVIDEYEPRTKQIKGQMDRFMANIK